MSFPADIFRRDDGPLNCTTESSGDYYGFGVRLGVYLGWLSSYFANTLLPGEIAGTLDTNTIFLFALLVSLFQGTFYSSLYQIDGLMVLHLCSGFLFSSLSIWGYRTLHYQREGSRGILQFGGLGTHFRLLLITVLSMYGAWFWLEGIQDGLHVQDDIPGCETVYTWFFHQWDVLQGVHVWYGVVTLLCSIYYGFMCIAAAITILHKIFSTGPFTWKKHMTYQTGLKYHELKLVFLVMRLFNLFWIVFCAAIIEMTLVENHMLDVLSQNIKAIRSPAQLVPLCIGAASFARTLYLIAMEHGQNVVKIIREETAIAPTSTAYKIKRALELTLHKLLFPASMHGRNPDEEHHEEDADSQTDVPAEKRQGHYTTEGNFPVWVRYTVAYLPWLAVFGNLFGKPFEPLAVLPTTKSDCCVHEEKEAAYKVTPEMEIKELGSPVPSV